MEFAATPRPSDEHAQALAKALARVAEREPAPGRSRWWHAGVRENAASERFAGEAPWSGSMGPSRGREAALPTTSRPRSVP
jgi:hypothetical protein